MIAWVRTILFRIVFYTVSVPIVLSAPIAALFGQRAAIDLAHFWIGTHRVLAHAILGIRVRVQGYRVDGPALYAAKHQAMFETLELAALIDGPMLVLKRELLAIPGWGFAARAYGAIGVDREASSQALRHMLKEAAAARASGRSVLLFPEGTRVPPGEQPPLKSGFAGLYKALALPVVPIALDTGRLLPRKGPARSGVVTIRFGEPVPPGLPRAEAEARVHAAINALDQPAADTSASTN